MTTPEPTAEHIDGPAVTAQPGATVAVVAGQWTGWTGTVLETLSGGHLWVRLEHPGVVFFRALRPDEVEVTKP